MKSFGKNAGIAAYASALTAFSIYAVLCGAADEPFHTFIRSEALLQIGATGGLMALWIQFAIGLILMTLAKRLSSWWLVLVPWAIVMFISLFEGQAGYIDDITNFVVNRSV